MAVSETEVKPLLLGEDANDELVEHLDGGLGVADPPEGQGGVVAQVLFHHLQGRSACCLKYQGSLDRMKCSPMPRLIVQMTAVIKLDLIADFFFFFFFFFFF